MVTVTVGGGIDWGLILGVVGTLLGSIFGVAFGWWLQTRRESRLSAWRTRGALALMHTEVTEAIFKVDQIINHQKASPVRGSTTFMFPSFRTYVGELDAVLSDKTMGLLAKIVNSTEDMGVLYQRVAAATASAPPQQPWITDLTLWLQDLKTTEADLTSASEPYMKLKR